MQLEKLKECIEVVRKNPKAFFKAHGGELDSDIERPEIARLLCLLFSTSGQDSSVQFEKIEQMVSGHRDFNESMSIEFYYEAICGIHARNIFAYSKSLSHFVKAYDLAIQLDDIELVARVMIYLSAIFDMIGNREQALHYATNAVQMVTKLSRTTLIGDIYMHYGLMHERQGDLFECLNAYRYAESYYELCDDRQEYLNYCILLMNSGRNHLNLGHDSTGEEYIGRALEIAEKGEFMMYLNNSIKVISDFYMGKGDYKRANDVLILFLQSHINASRSKERILNNQIDSAFLDKLNGLHQLYRENHQLTEEIKVLQNSFSGDFDSNQQVSIHLKDVAEAIRRDEFHPYLQAKWDIVTRKITGAEMLARWIKVDGTVIGPYDFIDLIENNDLIIPFSEGLIHKAMKVIASIVHNQEPLFKLSINVSPYQLVYQDLVTLLESCCVEHNLMPQNIEVEIIERTFIENNPKAIQQLFNLKARGFGIALDDFGSGYSSLGCIVELPIDTVKIDRSLVKYVDASDKSERLFRSIIAMMKRLDIATVAEGIEKESQLKIIQDCGCDEGQGFLIHKPCQAALFTI